MKFGAKINKNKSITFKLWAPDAHSVSLILMDEEPNIQLPMQADCEKVFSINTNLAKIGSKYMFLIDNNLQVCDPVSKQQTSGILSPSIVCAPPNITHTNNFDFDWKDAILYEMHIGTFTREGTFSSAEQKLDHLKELGINVIEIMPIAQFSGARNWGYDGVLMFAPNSSYGTPDELRSFIKSAHSKGIKVILDVVYNHFGPDGNYLYCYARSKFFSSQKSTPWGDAINYSEQKVRDFYISNAIYWIEEFDFDGLRLDAVHEIHDSSNTHILDEIADSVHKHFLKTKKVYLILENDKNETTYLHKNKYCSQWNDDFHHCMHVLLTGETNGYYEDFCEKRTPKSALHLLGKSLCEGFVYQGEYSIHRGISRGQVSSHLSPKYFVNFLQNHDQIGNRAFGERISDFVNSEQLKAAIVLYLLTPQIPMIFMGEEWGASTPFQYFCDYQNELADSVREGRQREFESLYSTINSNDRPTIPDPVKETTFANSKLNWSEIELDKHKQILNLYQKLLTIRKNTISPIIDEISSNNSCEFLSNKSLITRWNTKKTNQTKLIAVCNFGDSPVKINQKIEGALLLESKAQSYEQIQKGILIGNTTCWLIN